MVPVDTSSAVTGRNCSVASSQVYDTPSPEYGIDGGRISKLTIMIDDVTTANYDRSWDMKPANDATWKALQVLLHEYN